MIEARQVSELRSYLAHARARRQRVAFVPTMGNLHDGHLRLMREARRYADTVVASIYVNPLQFGPHEDFAAYPRTPAEDREALLAADVDLLFMPDERDIYPRGAMAQTIVEVPGIGAELCGRFRPGHFRGVATVVCRLFNLVAPDVALFGKKDYQQWLVIKWMVADLGMPIEIVGVDTVREADGLALSSRNRYLSADQRALAPSLYRALLATRDAVRRGQAIADAEAAAVATLHAAGFVPDYVSVRRAEDLAVAEKNDRALVVLAAATLGRTRLIDNLEFERAE